MRETPPIILEAIRRVEIEKVAGGKFRGGAVRVGPCPLCMKGARVGDCFKVRDRRWYCHRCQEGGDVVSLEALLANVGMVEAAQRLLGGDWRERAETPEAAPTKPAEGPSEREARYARYAAEIWKAGQPFAGSLAEAYLGARGIVPAVLEAMAPNLRFNPRARWFWAADERRWITGPAMVALRVVAGPDGRPRATGGVHMTVLAPDGLGKASDPRAAAKVMWGPQALEGRAGGAWLIGPNAPWLEGVAGCVGAEGIETAASVASLSWLRHGVVPRAWAALSLDALQGRLAKDDDRRVDLSGLGTTPGSAFTWPGIEDLEIGVDRDMRPLTFAARNGRGKPCDVVLEGEGRTRLSARMAVKAWRDAGTRRVHAIAPPRGSDFNDELRRVLARKDAAA